MRITKVERAKYRAMYQVTTALRGCDLVACATPCERDPLSAVKWEITARLRALCYSKVNMWGLYRERRLTEGAALDDRVKALQKLRKRPKDEHWLAHLRDAVAKTSLHPIWGGLTGKILDGFDTQPRRR